MTLDADSLAERRRLKRRVRFWRTGAILLAVVAVVSVLLVRQEGFLAQLGLNPHVARVSVSGFITDSRPQRELLEDLRKNEQVRGVIVYVDSPGGTTAGAEALYNSLRRIADEKPVVAVFGTAATSAAYLAGIAADHIVARGNSITGSVGVILQWAEFSELLEGWGINVQEVRSGDLKAVPSPFKPADPQARALVEEIVDEARNWFVGLVAERRDLNAVDLEQVRTGRIYSGRQAVQIGLIDQIGDETTALQWLQEQRGLPSGIEVIDRKAESESSSFMMKSLNALAVRLFGGTFEGLVHFFADNRPLNQLDGLISLWHPRK